MTGEDLAGQQITDEVQRRIGASDAMLAFLTRRGGPDENGIYGTHRWVSDELAVAIGKGMTVLEIREQGVDDQGGVAGDRQRLEFDEMHRDRLLVDLATTVSAWKRTAKVSLQLLPPEFVEVIRPVLGADDFECVYTLLEGSQESEPLDAKVQPIKGGLFVQTPGIPVGTYIRIFVNAGGRRWTSDYETADSVGIQLRPE